MCGLVHVPACPRVPVQVLTAVSVSTGCLSYGLCMAYTSSATPSIMEQVDENILCFRKIFFFTEGAVTLDPDQATWMASLLCIGALLGSLSAVFLMDAVGRKVS